jgi:hypothetical protein
MSGRFSDVCPVTGHGALELPDPARSLPWRAACCMAQRDLVAQVA